MKKVVSGKCAGYGFFVGVDFWLNEECETLRCRFDTCLDKFGKMSYDNKRISFKT